jgi:hypothetical protein
MILEQSEEIYVGVVENKYGKNLRVVMELKSKNGRRGNEKEKVLEEINFVYSVEKINEELKKEGNGGY